MARRLTVRAISIFANVQLPEARCRERRAFLFHVKQSGNIPMTTEKAPPPAREKSVPTGEKLTPVLARALWFSSGRPTIADFAIQLQEQGYHAPRTTLERWCNGDKKWKLARAQKEEIIPAENIIAALKEARDVSGEMAADVFLGAKAQLVARLYETIKVMPITTIDEWAAGLDCCEKIEALIHIERGKAITDDKRRGALLNVSPALMNRVEPEVVVAPFKRAN
jgi:hypothetical protein